MSWTASDDEAGVWGFDVQVQQGGEGGWIDWLKLHPTDCITSALYQSGQHDTLYCFRARAWDRVGNTGPWSTDTPCTRLDLERELQLSLGPVFGDQDGDGIWDIETGEPALDHVTFRLVDEDGTDVVTPSQGQSLEITRTLRTGEYTVLINPEGWPSPPPGWLPRRVTFDLPPGETTWELDEPAIGLLRHRASSYLPLVGSDDS